MLLKMLEYLGHIVWGERVKADPKNEAMVKWPRSTTLKSLRGFLGLTGYYRKFIKGYVAIAAPLTAPLKKDSFGWNEETEEAFERFKVAVMQPFVLSLPDFSKTFTIECDASGIEIEVELMQEGKPIAFLSKVWRARCKTPIP